MKRAIGLRCLFALALGLLYLATYPAAAQQTADLKRLMARDAVLVSQAIGWSLQGPVSDAEAAPVVFAPGTKPRPIANGTMRTRKIVLIDFVTPAAAPSRRWLSGVIELADALDHRVLARFETEYDIAAAGAYRVSAMTVNEIYPTSPRVEAYIVPAAAVGPAGLAASSPFAMLAAIRSKAINPALVDPAPREYRVYVVGLDRLPPQADLGFTAIDAAAGKEVAGSQSERANGWIVASMPLTFAMNGRSGIYFPIGYRPDGAAGREQMLMLFSNRFPDEQPVVAEKSVATPAPGLPTLPGLPPPPALPLAPGLSAMGQGFMTKSYPNQNAPR